MPEALWRRCSHWCVEMQPKWSATQGSLQGEGGRRGGREGCGYCCGRQCVCENVRACACVYAFAACEGWQDETSDWLLWSMSIIVLLLTPSSLFPPRGLVSTQYGLQQSPVACCSWLIKLVSVTGRPYLKHMAMSVSFTLLLFNV